MSSIFEAEERHFIKAEPKIHHACKKKRVYAFSSLFESFFSVLLFTLLNYIILWKEYGKVFKIKYGMGITVSNLYLPRSVSDII